jgi:uncharacterized membrane protein
MRARWLTIAVAVSVALNLFFLGLFSARAFQRHEVRTPWAQHGAPGAPGARRGWQRQQRPFDWMSDEERADLRPRRKEIRSARRQAEEALRAEPFDGEKLRQALNDLRRETDGIQAAVHDSMLKRALTMDGDARRRLADSQWGAEHGPERGPGHGPERGPERGGDHGPDHGPDQPR